MMKILVAALMIAPSCVLSTIGSSAQDYPFCLNSCSYGGCTYSTLQQCQATASGLDGWCEANPSFRQTNNAPPASHARQVKRRL